MGTQEERRVQHHKTQKEHSVHPALETKGNTYIFQHVFVKHYERAGNAAGTQGIQHYRTQKERRVRMEKRYGRRWNAAGTQEGTQMERRVQTASNYKSTTGGKGTQQERRADSCYMMN